MTFSQRDKKNIWHPYTQHKNAFENVAIVKAKGTYLFDEKGKMYIDAVSSWWTNIHGHSHPYIAKKIFEQAKKLEHVIFAGFTHEPAITLSERLLKLLPTNQKKIFYSDNGSTAIEVALKMSFQFWYNKEEKRKKVIAFKNAYHGDTFGAMSVSGRSAFTNAFTNFLFDVIYIDAPVKGKEKESINQLSSVIKKNKKNIACFIFEPLVQGTAGMRIHSSVALSEMISTCRKQNIICIADEVMTGFGRTGKLFASDYLKKKPDIFCLSKGISGGAMPLGVTSCTAEIYSTFLSDDKMKTFFHGHSYTANPLACSAANASLELFEKEKTIFKIEQISKGHLKFSKMLRTLKNIKEIRCLGTILAIEIKTKQNTSYFNSIRDEAYSFFLEKGILIRPLGNVIYIMPPYCISNKDLNYIYASIIQFLK